MNMTFWFGQDETKRLKEIIATKDGIIDNKDMLLATKDGIIANQDKLIATRDEFIGKLVREQMQASSWFWQLFDLIQAHMPKEDVPDPE